ncbi:pyrimidine 5-nucleotidase [Pleurotus eryngii]|uniref:Pyrimidine 5-nucleotidase n=1 Tax=Pleurotus eryngii TaxID=5323 RepID=A0A9P6D760_PLEER|nr:pyrimidine 5-nucleotidase [Pleurotus eryngii]
MSEPSVEKADDRPIVWFDIDNTLYSASTKISQAMGQRIHAYFLTLGLDDDAASELHHRYYTQYGLALRGLTRHHQIDPIDFDRKCDGSLPLEDMIFPSESLRQLFLDINRSKFRVWALTNAYRTHAERVLMILNLTDQIDGLVFCDYAEPNFVCKPEPAFYEQALKVANVSDPTLCYFIDDNKSNVLAAKQLGWGRCVHFCEHGLESVEGGKKLVINNSDVNNSEIVSVTNLEELRSVWPEIFKQ